MSRAIGAHVASGHRRPVEPKETGIPKVIKGYWIPEDLREFREVIRQAGERQEKVNWQNRGG